MRPHRSPNVNLIFITRLHRCDFTLATSLQNINVFTNSAWSRNKPLMEWARENRGTCSDYVSVGDSNTAEKTRHIFQLEIYIRYSQLSAEVNNCKAKHKKFCTKTNAKFPKFPHNLNIIITNTRSFPRAYFPTIYKCQSTQNLTNKIVT